MLRSAQPMRNSIVIVAVGLLSFGAAACSGSDGVSSSSVANDTQQTQLVTTPFGLASAACVMEVDPNAVVTTAALPPCPTPIVPAQGDGGVSSPASDSGAADSAAGESFAGEGGNEGGESDASVASVPTATATINGWVEYADWRASETPGELATTWHVPAVPTSNVGQTIFYFPSYETANGSAIVQPVLQYGVSAAGGGSYWAIASWWVGAGGAARYSSLLTVNPGDTIRGTITATNCDTNGGCKFVIVTRDETLDNSRQLTVVETVPYTWAQAGVLEMYDVNGCNQLPANDVTFSSFVFNDQNGSPLSATWTPEYPVHVRNCDYQVSAASDGSSVTLNY
jgi:hypothetical protein